MAMLGASSQVDPTRKMMRKLTLFMQLWIRGWMKEEKKEGKASSVKTVGRTPQAEERARPPARHLQAVRVRRALRVRPHAAPRSVSHEDQACSLHRPSGRNPDSFSPGGQSAPRLSPDGALLSPSQGSVRSGAHVVAPQPSSPPTTRAS